MKSDIWIHGFSLLLPSSLGSYGCNDRHSSPNSHISNKPTSLPSKLVIIVSSTSIMPISQRESCELVEKCNLFFKTSVDKLLAVDLRPSLGRAKFCCLLGKSVSCFVSHLSSLRSFEKYFYDWILKYKKQISSLSQNNFRHDLKQCI